MKKATNKKTKPVSKMTAAEKAKMAPKPGRTAVGPKRKQKSAMKLTAAQKKLPAKLQAIIKKKEAEEGAATKMKKAAMKLKDQSAMMMKKAAMKMKKVSAMKMKMKSAAKMKKK